MKKFLQGYFYNPSRGNLSIKGVIHEIIRYIEHKPDKFYDIIVGCDSSSGQSPHFPVAVVVLRKGEGGRFFLKKINYQGEKQFYNWRQRILEEVLLSCDLALFLRENLAQQINRTQGRFHYEFRYIHADVGENGATRDMIKEVTGLIRGNGFEARIKPEAYAASVVADRYT